MENAQNADRVRVGQGQFTYEVVHQWGKVPDGWQLLNVASIGVDSRDRVYVFNRGEHPMLVFDRDGNFLDSWGEGMFGRPHGVFIAPDDTIFLADDRHHVVRRFTSEGKELMRFGTPGKPAPYMSGEPFNRCTHAAMSPQGDVYITDGYGNSRVHKYGPDGKHILSWGAPGCGPGEFQIVHNILCDTDGWVYVADRENHRIQVFDGNGRYETQWQNLHRPLSLHFDRRPGVDLLYIGEAGPVTKTNRPIPNLGPRITVADKEGHILARLGADRAGSDPGYFIDVHGVAADSCGDIYVGDGAFGNWPKLFPEQPLPANLSPLKKLVRIA